MRSFCLCTSIITFLGFIILGAAWAAEDDYVLALTFLGGLASTPGTAAAQVKIINHSASPYKSCTLVVILPKPLQPDGGAFQEMPMAQVKDGDDLAVKGLQGRMTFLKTEDKANSRAWTTDTGKVSGGQTLSVPLSVKFTGSWPTQGRAVVYSECRDLQDVLHMAYSLQVFDESGRRDIVSPHLILEQGFSQASAVVGDALVYRFRIVNQGNDVANNLALTLNISTALTVKNLQGSDNLKLRTSQNLGNALGIQFQETGLLPGQQIMAQLDLQAIGAGKAYIMVVKKDDLTVMDNNPNAFIEIAPKMGEPAGIEPQQAAWKDCRAQYTDEAQIKGCVKQRMLQLLKK